MQSQHQLELHLVKDASSGSDTDIFLSERCIKHKKTDSKVWNLVLEPLSNNLQAEDVCEPRYSRTGITSKQSSQSRIKSPVSHSIDASNNDDYRRSSSLMNPKAPLATIEESSEEFRLRLMPQSKLKLRRSRQRQEAMLPPLHSSNKQRTALACSKFRPKEPRLQ